MEGIASSHVYGIYIYTYLDDSCHHREEKIRMAYKAEGDGLQIDNLCHKGYTYQMFMWNYPV